MKSVRERLLLTALGISSLVMESSVAINHRVPSGMPLVYLDLSVVYTSSARGCLWHCGAGALHIRPYPPEVFLEKRLPALLRLTRERH